MEQQLAAGLGEGPLSQLVQDQEVEAGDQISGSALPFSAGFSVKFVHEINTVEEPSSAATPNAGPGDAAGEMGFAGSGTTDQHEVALVIKEVATGQVADQGLVDLGRLEVELLPVPWPVATWRWSSGI